jgi:serralysin
MYADMYASSFMLGNVTLISRSSSLIQASFGAYLIRMHGNYTYNEAGQLTGGTFTGMDVFYLTTPQYSIQGLSTDILSLTYNPAASSDAAIFSKNDILDGSSRADVLIAYNGNDILNGNDGNDRLLGGGGNDTLNGSVGSDILSGGAGVDQMVGGTGNDTYYVDNARDVVVEASALPSEIDRVISSVTHTLSANVENLTLSGTAIKGTGNALNNTIAGNTANNVLSGGAGTDRLNGGAGNDTYYVNSIGDVVVETSTLPSEVDRITSSVTYTLSANVENLTLTGTTAINGIGNVLNNMITGNAAANTLNGGAGDDMLIGGAGNDILVGGTGVDTFAGGTGNDIYEVNNIPPATSLAVTSPPSGMRPLVDYTFFSEKGTWATESFDMTGDGIVDYVRISCYEGMYGNSFTIDFGPEQLGRNLTTGSYLNAKDATWAILGSPGLSFTMNSFGYGPVSGNFTIYSINIDYSGATPVLRSLSASFLQSSGPDGEVYTGSFRYNLPVSTLGERVTERANEGTDHVISSVSYALSANVENLTLSGTAVINGTGNGLGNVIIGNNADNILTGGLGTDTLTGNLGADIFDFITIADSAVGVNCDTVTDFVCGIDKIDLSTIDAIAYGSDDAFTFIDMAAFTGAGQLRFNNGVLYGNIDANLTADFQIALTGVATFASTDALL